jgi:hypothetical protein
VEDGVPSLYEEEGSSQSSAEEAYVSAMLSRRMVPCLR